MFPTADHTFGNVFSDINEPFNLPGTLCFLFTSNRSCILIGLPSTSDLKDYRVDTFTASGFFFFWVHAAACVTTKGTYSNSEKELLLSV